MQSEVEMPDQDINCVTFPLWHSSKFLQVGDEVFIFLYPEKNLVVIHAIQHLMEGRTPVLRNVLENKRML